MQREYAAPAPGQGRQRAQTPRAAAKSGSSEPSPASGPQRGKCGGRGLFAHWPTQGAGPPLRPASSPRWVHWASRRLRELFIGGRGLGLFTRCHWLDLNRPDCGPAAGRSSRGPGPAPDSCGRKGRGWRRSGSRAAGVPSAEAGGGGGQVGASALLSTNANRGLG